MLKRALLIALILALASILAVACIAPPVDPAGPDFPIDNGILLGFSPTPPPGYISRAPSFITGAVSELSSPGFDIASC
jgi:hypothetical protein